MNSNEMTLENLRGTNPTPIQTIINSHLNQADRDVVKSLNEEDLLDLQMADMTEDEAEAHVLACDTYLEFNGNPIPHDHLTIVEADLILFKDFLVEATKKRTGTERYITALSITFGAIGDRIMPIFQSVYLKWIRYDSASQKDLYDAPYTSYGKCYKFDNAGFALISQTDKEQMLENYKLGVKIAHKSSEGLQKFRPTVDVESILIPLQTIYTVTCNTTSLVGYITHGVREVQYDSASPRKHIVMANGLNLMPFVGNTIIYANRSHLCPPCTTSFGFDLA